jgi:hypothetical protein
MKVIVTGELGKTLALLNASFYTGASGVLGTAVFDAFKRAAADNTVIGLANSRSGGERNHHKLNLLDFDAVSTFFRETKPDCKCDNMMTQLPPITVDNMIPVVLHRGILYIALTPPPHLRKIAVQCFMSP